MSLSVPINLSAGAGVSGLAPGICGGTSMVGGYLVDSIDFDGTTAYYTRGANFTGVSDGKTGTFSGWFRIDGGDGVAKNILTNSDATATMGLRILKSASDKFQVTGRNAAGTAILTLVAATAHTAGTTWYHVAMSWDLANGLGHMYVNGVDDLSGSPTLTDDTLDYAKTDWAVGASTDGDNMFNGCMAELWFSTDYIDLSVAGALDAFRLPSGRPAYLGRSGELVTGTAPALYMSLYKDRPIADFDTNLGSGGGMTLTGTVTRGSSSPAY